MRHSADDNSGKPRRRRTEPSGRRLTAEDAALIKGMLARGDRQSHIAAHFGAVNQGRIAEIAAGQKFEDVPPAPSSELPPPLH